MKFAMASGKLIDITNFTVDDVDLNDIAHNLSKIQRFNGAIPIDKLYSIAEHSINLTRKIYIDYKDVSFYCAPFMRYSLLHDATEAYLSDILTPVKSLLADYKALEDHIHQVIMKRFNLSADSDDLVKPELVKPYDKRILIDEVETIMPDKLELYQRETKLEKLGCDITYNNHPSTVKQCFLTIAKRLRIE